MRIVVIGLCLEKGNQAAYAASSAEEKINLITARIDLICKDLKKDEPHSSWIITWREGGIYEINKAPISSTVKKKFKEKMKALCVQYPRLNIIAGPMLISKHSDVKDDLTKIKARYDDNKWIETLEDIICAPKERRYWPDHTKKIDSAIAKYPNNGVDISRITSYVIQQPDDVDSDVAIQRHDKMFPAFGEFDTSIYKPGSNWSASTLLTIRLLNHAPLSVSVEICREHGIGLLKYEQKNRVFANPIIQFVLSNHISLFKDHFAAPYVIHMDSKLKPSITISNETDFPSEYEVVFYEHSALESYTPSIEVIPKFHYHPGPYLSESELIQKLNHLLLQFSSSQLKHQLYFFLRKAISNQWTSVVAAIMELPDSDQLLSYVSAHFIEGRLINIAQDQGNKEILFLLLCKLNDDTQFTRALTLAVNNRFVNLVQRYINLGADPNKILVDLLTNNRRSHKLISTSGGLRFLVQCNPMDDTSRLIAQILLTSKKINLCQVVRLFHEAAKINDIDAIEVLLQSNLIQLNEIKLAAEVADKNNSLAIAYLLQEADSLFEQKSRQEKESTIDQPTAPSSDSSKKNSLKITTDITFFQSDEKNPKPKKNTMSIIRRCTIS